MGRLAVLAAGKWAAIAEAEQRAEPAGSE